MKSRKNNTFPLCKQCSLKIIFGDIFYFESWAEDQHAMPLCAIFYFVIFFFNICTYNACTGGREKGYGMITRGKQLTPRRDQILDVRCVCNMGTARMGDRKVRQSSVISCRSKSPSIHSLGSEETHSAAFLFFLFYFLFFFFSVSGTIHIMPP